jgi:starvation-inducible DNA-binding protein
MTDNTATTRRPASLHTPTSLGAQATRDISGALNALLADFFALYLKTKNFHWHVFGPHFRDYHLLFGEHADQVLETVDELAERALMVDGKPLADPPQYLPASFVEPSQGDRGVKQMLEEAIAGHDKVIRAMHDDAEVASKAGDIGTADLFTRLVQVHQKQRWFLKEIARREA